MKRLFGLLLAGTLVAAVPLAACANNTAAPASTGTEETAAEGTAETGVTQAEIESKIIGTWVVADEDGKPAPTNDKLAYDLVSLSKAKVYASLDTPLEGTSSFLNAVEADFVLEGAQFAGDKLILSYNQDASTHAWLCGKDGARIREIALPDASQFSWKNTQ